MSIVQVKVRYDDGSGFYGTLDMETMTATSEVRYDHQGRPNAGDMVGIAPDWDTPSVADQAEVLAEMAAEADGDVNR